MIKPGSPLLGIKNIPWLAVCFGFTLFMIILLLPLFLLHKEPIWDALSIGYPSFTYLADAIRGGRLPLWDPYTNCGLPFYADPNTFTLNPIAMFLGTTLQRSIHGFIAFWTFHWWLAGIGMIWLAKHFGARPLGGLFAAITFTLSGFFIGHAEHTTFIVVAGWVPWIILFADKAVLSSNKGWALLSGVCMGMTSYGGYHGLIPFTGLAVAIWLGLRFLSDRKKTMQVISTLIIIAVISIIAWSPLIYAFLTEGATYTDKVSALTSAGANYGNVFTVQALLSLFLPYATTVGLPPMYSDISMTNAYMGLFTIPFAVLWCWNEKNRRRFWSIFIFTVFMFIVSLGGLLPELIKV